MLALIAVYLACFRKWTDHLAPGERAHGHDHCRGPSPSERDQGIYHGHDQNVPVLKAELVRETGDEIELKNQVMIEIGTRYIPSDPRLHGHCRPMRRDRILEERRKREPGS